MSHREALRSEIPEDPLEARSIPSTEFSPSTIGLNVRQVRLLRGKYLLQTAIDARISIRELSKIEAGHTKYGPNERIIRGLAASLETSVSYLFDEVDSSDPEAVLPFSTGTTGQHVAGILRARELNITNFAAHINMHHWQISGIVQVAHYPSEVTLRRIAAGLEVPIGYLFGEMVKPEEGRRSRAMP